MKVYFARPVSQYGNKQDERDLEMLKELGFKVVNPNKEALAKEYQNRGMDTYLDLVVECDLVVFRSFVDGKISAGVWKEINCGVPVLELPTLPGRELSVETTREYLTLLGQR
jgi:hypothetical protein